MSQIGKLSWLNENALTPYPLVKSIGYDDVLLDANFIQFDNFTPVLQSITVTETGIVFTIQFDLIVKDITIPSNFFTGVGVSYKIYEDSRYLGCLVFGRGIFNLLETKTQLLNLNASFLSHLVRGIPSGAGVYSIQNKYGEVTLSKDINIWYVVSGGDVTINAVAVKPYTDTPYLKTLNGVPPRDNNVIIKDNAVIKPVVAGLSTLKLESVGTTKDIIHSE